MRPRPKIKSLPAFLMALCLVFSAALPVSAEKTDWADSNYDFHKIQKALIYDIELSDTEEFESDLLEQTLQEEYLKNAMRPGYRVLDAQKAALLSPENPVAAADVYIKAELLKWHDDSYEKPAYTSWETQRSTRTRKLPNGEKIEDTYYTTVPVYHPPQIIYTSTVRLRFEVFDSKTGQRVMARDELRLRDDSHHGQKGIFGRICKSFFNDLKKKING